MHLPKDLIIGPSSGSAVAILYPNGVLDVNTFKLILVCN